MKPKSYIKVRLTDEVRSHIESRSKELGMSISTYMFYLAVKDTRDPRQRVALLVIENLNDIVRELNKIRLRRAFKKGGPLDRFTDVNQ
ncbi:hypothetical protein A3F34_00690 [Candidatus Roizmanbacteria bacterium RIFCSPHIGHO2_12_FULL_44_10]|uniref:Uncharacterized protein n=1 Tax=Candidatus Roizmanbacteria bacterium RIFCSPHIGHO2_12_FULL_44_10 TaxID=1802054 RepID=A0A1F7I7V5_9BACT|nr:MAG: hypothetical protein A3F34_00690 [Candidatus Roizmanbacteria bacterium RIFCSPHIGHO2_12_FULL_44_10]